MSAVATSRPDWIERLAEACRETSQKAVAAKIGYSPAVVSTVLKGSYKGSLHTVEKAVRGAFFDQVVECPVLGRLPTNQCLEMQRRPFAATNAQRVRLYRACRRCPNREDVS